MADCTQEAGSTGEPAWDAAGRPLGSERLAALSLTELVQPERILHKLASVKQLFFQEGTEPAA